jgi:hypothetical protein
MWLCVRVCAEGCSFLWERVVACSSVQECVSMVSWIVACRLVQCSLTNLPAVWCACLHGTG